MLLRKYWAARKRLCLSASFVSVGVCCCLTPAHATILSASEVLTLAFREIPAVSHQAHLLLAHLVILCPQWNLRTSTRSIGTRLIRSNCSVYMWLIARLHFRRNRSEQLMVFWDNGCFLFDRDLRLFSHFRLHNLIWPLFISFVSFSLYLQWVVSANSWCK